MPSTQRMVSAHNRELLDKLDPILSSVNDGPSDEKATNPLLISYNSEYFHSDLRIMLFGQETNKWNTEFNDGFYAHNQESLEERYDEFFWSRACFDYGRSYGGMWRGAEYLMNEIENTLRNREVAFVWNNAVKVGKLGKGRPGFYYNIRDINRYAILQEIELFAPNLMIFFSGPDYDDVLIDIFDSQPDENLDGYTLRQMGVMNAYGINAIRTYHPNFLLRNDYRRYYSDISDYVANLFD